MKDTQKLAIALKALKAIADCPEEDCVRYVLKVDAIASDAIIAIELGD